MGAAVQGLDHPAGQDGVGELGQVQKAVLRPQFLLAGFKFMLLPAASTSLVSTPTTTMVLFSPVQ